VRLEYLFSRHIMLYYLVSIFASQNMYLKKSHLLWSQIVVPLCQLFITTCVFKKRLKLVVTVFEIQHYLLYTRVTFDHVILHYLGIRHITGCTFIDWQKWIWEQGTITLVDIVMAVGHDQQYDNSRLCLLSNKSWDGESNIDQVSSAWILASCCILHY
jgi:hypothetical protein